MDGLVENNLRLPAKPSLRTGGRVGEVRAGTSTSWTSSSLVHYADERLSDETEEEEGLSKGEKIVRFIRPIALVAALLVAGFYLPRSLVDDKATGSAVGSSSLADPSQISDDVIVDTVAVLTKTVGVEWADDASFRPESGTTLEPCKLKLKSGLAQVEFLQGSTIVLEGPVEFEIINPNGGALQLGSSGPACRRWLPVSVSKFPRARS